MIAPTRLLAVLAATALAAPAAAHAQGGAGDDQYQDPFGGSTPKTTKSPPASPTQRAQVQQKAQSSQPSLSTAPPAQSSATQTSSRSSAAPSTATGTLPYTGTEIPGMALLGIGILAAGVGLRLRTLDDSIF